MNESRMQRRTFLKLGAAALAMIPVVVVSGQAKAATNAGLRTAFKYRDKPQADKDCSNCNLFAPGKTPTDLGGCSVIPGDTEISPKGYCVAWAKKA